MSKDRGHPLGVTNFSRTFFMDSNPKKNKRGNSSKRKFHCPREAFNQLGDEEIDQKNISFSTKLFQSYFHKIKIC